MTIFLVRHGESQWNAGETTDLDSGLSFLGTKQAKVVGGYLNRVLSTRRNVDVRIIHSSYQRAKETAEYIHKGCNNVVDFSLIVHEDARIGEARIKECGYPTDEETHEEITGRLTEFMYEQEEFLCDPDEHLIVVAHATSVLNMRNIYMGCDWFTFWGCPDRIRNCEVVTLL